MSRWRGASGLGKLMVGQSGCLCRGFVNGVARRLEERASERKCVGGAGKNAHLANSPLCMCVRASKQKRPAPFIHYSEDRARSSLDIHRRAPFPSFSSHAHNITGPSARLVLHHFLNTSCKSFPRRHDYISSTAFIT